MCRIHSATEDKQSGSDILDSVLLRIMIQDIWGLTPGEVQDSKICDTRG